MFVDCLPKLALYGLQIRKCLHPGTWLSKNGWPTLAEPGQSSLCGNLSGTNISVGLRCESFPPQRIDVSWPMFQGIAGGTDSSRRRHILIIFEVCPNT